MANIQPLALETFEATGNGGVSLAEYAGEKLVVFFYPRASTPGCTREAEGFRDHFDDFRAAGCHVLGVSRDKLATQQRFADKHGLPFKLIADPEERLCQAFDVIGEKMLYGKLRRGIQRSTFVLDESGKIMQEWRNVRVPGHVEQVLEYLRQTPA